MVFEELRSALQDYGIDICHPFPLPDFGREKPLAVIFGSTKQFWSKFEEFILERGLIADPVDTFYRYIIEEVVMTQHPFCDIKYEVRYDWGTPRKGNFVHVQTAGHFSGFAFYDETIKWSCHPEYGLWFSYRGTLILDIDFDDEIPSPTPVFTHDIKNEMIKYFNIANEERWQNIQTRLDLRDACPIGKDKWRYSGDMLDYFFPIHRPKEEVLKDMYERKKLESNKYQ